MKHKPIATRAQRAEIYRAQSIEQLEALRIKYGYSIGWLVRIVEARQLKARGY